MIQQIDHIAIAVQDIDKAARFYTEHLGLVVEGTEVVKEQKTKVAFIQVGEVRLELVQPTQDDSPVAKFLEKKGQGIHHIAVRTADIEAALEKLASEGVRLVDQKPRIGAHGAKIAFVHPKASGGVLMELCQRGG